MNIASELQLGFVFGFWIFILNLNKLHHLFMQVRVHVANGDCFGGNLENKNQPLFAKVSDNWESSF